MKNVRKFVCILLAAVTLTLSLGITSFAAATLNAPKVTITSTAGENPSIKLKWAAVSGAECYYIYRADSADGTMAYLDKTSEKYYLDKTAQSNKAYYYTVRSVVEKNGEAYIKSSASNKVTRTLVKLSAPVITVKGTASDKIKVSYKAVDGADKYYIYMSKDNGKYTLVAKTTATSYTLSKLSKESDYSFKVKAVKTANKKTYKSAYSNIVSGTVKLSGAELADRALKPYKSYKELMDMLKMSVIYDNQTSTLSETLTKGEAVKVAMAAVISRKFYVKYCGNGALDYNDYPDNYWFEMASREFKVKRDVPEESIDNMWDDFDYPLQHNELKDIIAADLTETNCNKKATYGEFVRWVERAKTVLREVVPISADKDVIMTGVECDNETRAAFSDLVASGIIKTVTENIDPNAPLTKALANEIFCNMFNEFDPFSENGYKLRTDNLPSNADFYPYILEGFTNKEYEYPTEKSYVDWDEFLTAKEFYVYQGDKMGQVCTWSKEYLEWILNVDYKTIDFESYRDGINNYMVFDVSDNRVKKYVDYVKKNHIVIKATATPIEPCFYYACGGAFRMRTKIEIEIVSSDTKKNLLLGDSDSDLYDNIEYKAKKFMLYTELGFMQAITVGGNGELETSHYMYPQDIVNVSCGIFYDALNKDELKDKIIIHE